VVAAHLGNKTARGIRQQRTSEAFSRPTGRESFASLILGEPGLCERAFCGNPVCASPVCQEFIAGAAGLNCPQATLFDGEDMDGEDNTLINGGKQLVDEGDNSSMGKTSLMASQWVENWCVNMDLPRFCGRLTQR